MTSIQIDIKDGLSSSVAIKGPCRVATTANITLSGEQTIDGIAVVTDERVLVKNQTTGSDNGIWICDTGPWRRAKDFNKTKDVKTGTLVVVVGGSTNVGIWQITTADPVTVGTTSVVFTNFIQTSAGLPFPAVANSFLQRNAGNTAYDAKTPTQVFDMTSPTTTRGDLIFRNATTNARLAASTAGYLLQTNGAGTDPTYAGFVQPVGSSPSTRTWQSKASDFVSILDYGGIGDGLLASASANATALTNALATGKKVWIPYTSAGYHFGTNQITVGTGQVIEGENQVLLKSTATTSLFLLTGFEVTSGIHNVKIDMTGSGASSTAIRFGTSSASVYRVRLSKIKFANCVEAIGDEVHVSNSVVDIIIDDCMCWLTRGRQIYIRRSAGFILVRSTNVDFTQDTGLVAWEGIRFENFAGLELERVDVLGWGTGVRAYNSGIYGIVISTGQALWLTRVFVDSYLGVGIFINAASYVFSTYLETSLCNGVGILLSSVSKGVFANTLINGNTGVTGAAAGAQGLYLDTVTDCTFTTTLAYNMSGSGIAAVTANNRLTFTGTITNTNLFGLALQGTSANVVFNGGSMNGNGTTVSNTASGTGNAIRNITGYNPVGAAAVTTSASPYTYTAGASPETLYFSASTGISAVTQSGGTSILPAALAANVPMTVELDPGQAVVITYTGTLTAKKMVH
jgi:hypothetical protein